jgi:iron complex transport system substrate-binding protein
MDLLIDNGLVVEIKAADALLPIHRAQLISYLRAVNLPLGLLLNFKTSLLKDGIERIVYSR